MSEPKEFVVGRIEPISITAGSSPLPFPTIIDPKDLKKYVERAAYDALAARLATVEKERDEAVALLRRFDNEEQDDTLGVDLVAFLARLAKTAGDRT